MGFLLFWGICCVIGELVLEVFRQYSVIILKVQEELFLNTLSLNDESSSFVSKHQELSIQWCIASKKNGHLVVPPQKPKNCLYCRLYMWARVHTLTAVFYNWIKYVTKSIVFHRQLFKILYVCVCEYSVILSSGQSNLEPVLHYVY